MNISNEVMIDVGHQLNGYTFRLAPNSEQLLAQLFAEAFSPATLFVSHETEQEFTTAYRAKWLPIWMLISGLSEVHLKSIDKIVFQQPYPQKDLLVILPTESLQNSTVSVSVYG
ncbi:MAG: hypothetical protein F6J92_35655 [Symploca sp. SIO1A3]|nr:hypothetical protein [Symploca sp. SIO2C1]NER51887.1 hypothetical protein [Symploca sp. SIO1A3]